MEFRGEIKVEGTDLRVISKQIMDNTKGLDKFSPPKDCWVLIACLNDGGYRILYFHVSFSSFLWVNCHHLTLDTGHIFTYLANLFNSRLSPSAFQYILSSSSYFNTLPSCLSLLLQNLSKFPNVCHRETTSLSASAPPFRVPELVSLWSHPLELFRSLF